MSRFPKYSALPLHILGESYGGIRLVSRPFFASFTKPKGHYAPHAASLIHGRNQDLAHGQQYLNLDSVILLNAILDPLIQLEYDVKLICDASRKILDPTGSECSSLRHAIEECKPKLRRCYQDESKCSEASDYMHEEILRQLSGSPSFLVFAALEGSHLPPVHRTPT